MRENLTNSFDIDGDAIVIPYEKEGVHMLRIVNFQGVQRENTVPETQDIAVTIYNNISNVSLLEFMNGFRSVNVQKNNDTTIISFKLYTEAFLLYEDTSEKIYTHIDTPKAGRLYIMDRDILQINSDKAVVLGPLTINVQTNGNTIELYIDDILKVSSYYKNFSWLWNERAFGEHTIKTIAFNTDTDSITDSVDVIIFNF
jgi:hypothetical protein